MARLVRKGLIALAVLCCASAACGKVVAAGQPDKLRVLLQEHGAAVTVSDFSTADANTTEAAAADINTATTDDKTHVAGEPDQSDDLNKTRQELSLTAGGSLVIILIAVFFAMAVLISAGRKYR